MASDVKHTPDWESRYREEEQIVSRIWTLLGGHSYEELAGRSIYDLIQELLDKEAAPIRNAGAELRSEALENALRAACGYMRNASIGLDCGATKRITSDLLEEGVKRAEAVLAAIARTENPA